MEANNETESVKHDEFKKVMTEFVEDMKLAFPELSDTLMRVKLDSEDDVKYMYYFCKQIYPSKFFDIIYQNEDIFNEDLYFLPNINFSDIWKLDISEQTKETIWKYLQLVLFTIVGSLKDKGNFGDAEALFEAIGEDEFKSKIEETIKNMEGFFDNIPAEAEGGANKDGETTGANAMPDAEDIHDHLNSMMDGKIGSLAKEIAEEAAEDLNIGEIKSTDELFKKLFRNPTKLMDLVKNVGTKLETKLKTGDLKESELLDEATQLMNNMKNMPGMGNLGSMFGKMGGAFGGKAGGKMNMGNFEAHMKQQMKQAKMRERMREKLEKREHQQTSSSVPTYSQGVTETSSMVEAESWIPDSTDNVTDNKPKKSKRGKKKKKKKASK